MGGFVVCGVARRDHPLKGGWSHNLPVGDSGDVVVLNVVTVPLRGGGPTVSPWEKVVALLTL